MTTTVTYDPAEQATRRRRARIAQKVIAERLSIAISKVSEYETGKKPLPWALTGADYERVLSDLIAEKEAAK